MSVRTTPLLWSATRVDPERLAAVRPAVGGFPYLAEALRSAGVTRCYVDVPSRTFRYVTADLGARGRRYLERYPAVDLPAQSAQS